MDASSSMPAPDVPPASDVLFFSNLHGRKRHTKRDIGLLDLQEAMKRGKQERAQRDFTTGAKRWTFTHGDIVYKTDSTVFRGVTWWNVSIDIPRASLTLKQFGENKAAKRRLREDPSLCTSHTVIVVDQSGSMRTPDVADFFDRSQAVFGMLALNFVAKQCLSGEATDADVVSLVRMQDDANVVIEREPMGLVLYNQLVGFHNAGTPRHNGNFLPALDEAERLLKGLVHDGCALALLFLSDGRPSDHAAYLRSGSCLQAEEKIASRVRALAETFGQQLSVSTLGFADPSQDFSVLEAMAGAARDGGAQGEFHRPDLSSEGLGSAISRSVSSLTDTRLRLTTLAVGNDAQPRALRKVDKEATGTPWGHAITTLTTADGWVVYPSDVQRFEFSKQRPSTNNMESRWVPAGFLSEEADGIAVRSKALGEGAERLVFGLQVCTKRWAHCFQAVVRIKNNTSLTHNVLVFVVES